jgi:exopolysaccharide biosynthesis predicted pyruvyltransferase EpsI
MIINIHRRAVDNIGDLLSSPINYFSYKKKTKSIDIISDYKSFLFSKFVCKLKSDKLHIIIGGGGLLDNNYFEKQIQDIINLKPDSLVFWGVGHNKHYDENEPRFHENTLDLLSKSQLWGVRDKIKDMKYLPCPSCMHEQLNSKCLINNDIVVYEHEHMPLVGSGLEDKPKMINNSHSFKQVIEFLNSANYIITNSYHGMYWAVLLKKKVIAIPFSTKFDLFPYKIPMGGVSQWPELIEKSQIYSNALNECRHINQNFYKKTLELFNA